MDVEEKLRLVLSEIYDPFGQYDDWMQQVFDGLAAQGLAVVEVPKQG